MKHELNKIVINDDNLLDDNIDKFTKKARAILVFYDKLLVANYGGVFLLPGGSIESKENEDKAIIRELIEETGILYNIDDLKKICLLNYYQKDYPTRDNKSLNRLVSTYYYLAPYKRVNKLDINLTENEKKDNFKLQLIEYKQLLKLISIVNENPRKKYFDRELKEVLEYVKKCKYIN